MTKGNSKLKTQISNLQLKTKNIVKAVNNIFVKVVLFLFYFLIIGLGALIYRFAKKENRKINSYWQDYPKKKLNFDYFKSPY